MILAGWTLGIAAAAAMAWNHFAGQEADTVYVGNGEAALVAAQGQPQDAVRERLQANPQQPYRVTLRTEYMCGEQSEALGLLNASAILKKWNDHPEWTADMEDGESVTLRRTIHDLSPKCKETGYIGVDASGNLSLYDGKPQHEKVLRTFFQLNMEYLESSLPPGAVKQLYAGIKVNDLEEYNSVLSTFSDYALEAKEKL